MRLLSSDGIISPISFVSGTLPAFAVKIVSIKIPYQEKKKIVSFKIKHETLDFSFT